MKSLFLALVLITASALRGVTVIETEKVKELKPTGSLGTCSYAPAAAEKPYFSRLPKSEVVTGSFMEPYSIHNKKSINVSWFAIVRGITPEPDSDKRFTLLLEHKFFDGMTDCHIMLVSVAGGGDFRATVETDGAQSIPALALVRVYGVVTKEEGGVPTVTADYIRVWPWHTFTLTDLGSTGDAMISVSHSQNRLTRGGGIPLGENGSNSVKSISCIVSSEFTWSSSWHKFVKSAASGRASETISATPTT